jgi:hypothetical protein
MTSQAQAKGAAASKAAIAAPGGEAAAAAPDAQTAAAAPDERIPVTIDGVTVLVHPDIADDMELFEILAGEWGAAGRSSNEATDTVRYIKKVLGGEYARVKRLLRNERGVTSAKRMVAFTNSLLEAMQKNS